eukprot:Sspe_Gene.89335::Locus_61099_Transcript_1_1_Confidence_1.000_Length_956::g.89335::m.89335/K22074/NFU1, HIRIP5; NFU1 iron-sulfur cluster scaffold homolog, mitochondrial
MYRGVMRARHILRAGVMARAAGRAPKGPTAVTPWRVLATQRRWCSYVVHMDHTPNPDCMKFSPEGDITLMPDGQNMDVTTEAQAVKSPLAERLFGISGVKSVFIADYWLTVTKDEGLVWDELSPQVMDTIREWARSGEPVINENLDFSNNEDTEIDPEYDSEPVQAIKELIQSRIKPMVQQDGGNIKYVGFDDGVVLLLMQGACQSCPSSGATLKGGIERMLMHWIPEVLEVQEVEEDFAEEYIIAEKENRKRYKRGPNGELIPRETPKEDEELLNTAEKTLN